MIALLLGAALAQEPQVVQPGESITALEKSFLLPEPMFDRCLEKALLLEETEAKLADVVDSSTAALDVSSAALGTAKTELNRCSTQIANLGVKLERHQDSTKELRRRNLVLTAVSISLGAALGVETYLLLKN